MINQFLSKFTKEDIQVYKENSPFFIKSDLDPQFGETIYYNVKTFGYPSKIIPNNFEEIGKHLISLGIIMGDIIRNDNIITIYNFNLETLNIVEDVLFNRKDRSNNVFLEKLLMQLNTKQVGIYAINKEFKVDYNIKNITDIEVMIHAISIKQPDLLKKIFDYLNLDNSLNNQKEIKQEINFIIPKIVNKLYFIYDDNHNLLFTLTNLESKIFKELRSKIKEGGISIENLRQITKQTPSATKKSIKQIQTKIKSHNIKEFIKISIKDGHSYLYIKSK